MKNTVTQIANTFSDNMIIDCARLSFNNRGENFTPESNKKLMNYLMRERHINPAFHGRKTIALELPDKELLRITLDKNLMAGLNIDRREYNSYITGSQWGLLMLAIKLNERSIVDNIRHYCPDFIEACELAGVPLPRHRLRDEIDFNADTPYNHQPFSFMFHTDLATKPQLYTHSVDFAKSALSHRYVEPEHVFTPDKWRVAPENKKQGSGEGFVNEEPYMMPHEVNHAGKTELSYTPIYSSDIDEITKGWYDANIAMANEHRRLKLTVSTMTKYVVTAPLEAWERVLGLRDTPHAQQEIMELMQPIKEALNVE